MARRNREGSNKKRAVRDILTYEDTITSEVEKTVQKIRERAKSLHNELDRYITSMLTELKQKFEQEMTRIRYAVEKLKGNNSSKNTSRASSLERSPRYRSTPKSKGSGSIDFSLNTSVASGFHDTDHMEQFDKKELTFFEGETSDTIFRTIVGYYTLEQSTPISFTAIQRSIQAHRRSEVKMVKSFKCGDQSETVHAIAPVKEDQAWICCGWGSRSLHLYNKHGLKEKSATLDIQVNDAVTYYDGHDDVVLISSYREKSIKRLNQDSLRTSDFAYISLFPGGISWDRRNGLYVCFRDSYQRTVTFGARRMVAKLSKHGEIIATMEKNDEQSNIFGYPFRIAVNSNGDICVSDYGDGTRGVTILHKDGRVKVCYKGPPSGMSNGDQPFLPHGIVCDDGGHILVSDWNNDCVHVLDSDGNFLLNLIDQKDGIEGPNALGLDKRGYLWVGDSHGIVRIFKYSIFDD